MTSENQNQLASPLDGSTDVDLTDSHVNAVLARWGSKVQEVIRIRQAEESAKGIAIVDLERFSGQVYSKGQLVEEFMQVAIDLPVSKSLVLLTDWAKNHPANQALAHIIAAFQLAGAIWSSKADVVLERFAALQDARVLQDLFDQENLVVDRVLRILKDEDPDLSDINEDVELA